MSSGISLSYFKRIFFGLCVLVLVSLACSITDSGSDDIQATTDSLRITADAVSHQLTLDAQAVPNAQNTQAPPPPQQQSSPPSIPKPPTRQPTQGVPAGQPTQAQPPQQNSMSGGGDFYIVNESTSSKICYFYMTASTEPEWGSDQLGSDTIILPGETFTLYNVPHDTYDALAEDCDENTLAEVYEFDFPPNDTFTLFDDSANQPLCGNGICGDFENPGNCPQDCGSGDEVILTLVNMTSEPVCYVWIGVPQSEWIGDLLGDNIIDGWSQVDVNVSVGEWALQAEDCSGTENSVMMYVPYLVITEDTIWFIDP